jgi:hypothetical protein
VSVWYPATYRVLAEMATGWENATCCQPLAVSLVNVACASRMPSAVHRLPTWVPVLAAAL